MLKRISTAVLICLAVLLPNCSDEGPYNDMSSGAEMYEKLLPSMLLSMVADILLFRPPGGITINAGETELTFTW